MSATIIPASTRYVDLEDISIDLVCFEHAMQALRDRRLAGRLQGYVEATLAANPGLSKHGAVVPLGTTVILPEFRITQTTSKAVRLWD